MAKERTRVRISFLVDVDWEGWALEYGVEARPNVVRRDVKEYIRRAIQEGWSAGFGMMEIVDAQE